MLTLITVEISMTGNLSLVTLFILDVLLSFGALNSRKVNLLSPLVKQNTLLSLLVSTKWFGSSLFSLSLVSIFLLLCLSTVTTSRQKTWHTILSTTSVQSTLTFVITESENLLWMEPSLYTMSKVKTIQLTFLQSQYPFLFSSILFVLCMVIL